MSRFPRRKVVSAHLSQVGINCYDVTLSCGHVTTAYGMAPKGDPHGRKSAPKTCECRRCAKA